MNRFKKKAMRVIAEHLSIEEVDVIREMFKLMDTANIGKVTFEELKAGLQKVGSQLAEPEMKMLMETVSFFVCLAISLLVLDSIGWGPVLLLYRLLCDVNFFHTSILSNWSVGYGFLFLNHLSCLNFNMMLINDEIYPFVTEVS